LQLFISAPFLLESASEEKDAESSPSVLTDKRMGAFEKIDSPAKPAGRLRTERKEYGPRHTTLSCGQDYHLVGLSDNPK
jgi:hypothetical protein